MNIVEGLISRSQMHMLWCIADAANIPHSMHEQQRHGSSQVDRAEQAPRASRSRGMECHKPSARLQQLWVQICNLEAVKQGYLADAGDTIVMWMMVDCALDMAGVIGKLCSPKVQQKPTGLHAGPGDAASCCSACGQATRTQCFSMCCL